MGRLLSWAAVLLLVVPGLALLAAAFLLPAYRGMVLAEHERDCVRERTMAFEDYLARTEEFIRTLPEDEQHTRRLRMMQERIEPPNEVAIDDPAAPSATPPGVVRPREPKMPPLPENRLLRLAGRLDDQKTRRGLLLAWALATAAAMLMFSPARRPPEAPAAQAGEASQTMKPPA